MTCEHCNAAFAYLDGHQCTPPGSLAEVREAAERGVELGRRRALVKCACGVAIGPEDEGECYTCYDARVPEGSDDPSSCYITFSEQVMISRAAAALCNLYPDLMAWVDLIEGRTGEHAAGLVVANLHNTARRIRAELGGGK